MKLVLHVAAECRLKQRRDNNLRFYGFLLMGLPDLTLDSGIKIDGFHSMLSVGNIIFCPEW